MVLGAREMDLNTHGTARREYRSPLVFPVDDGSSCHPLVIPRPNEEPPSREGFYAGRLGCPWPRVRVGPIRRKYESTTIIWPACRFCSQSTSSAAASHETH